MRGDIDKETLREIRRAYNRSGPQSTPWTIAGRFGLTTEDVIELCDPRRKAMARGEAKAAQREAKAARREAKAAQREAEAAELIIKRTAAQRHAEAEEKQANAIRRLWSAGTTGRAIAERFGIAPSKVSGLVADSPRPVRYAGPESAPRLPPLPKPVVPLPPPDPADRLVREPTVRGSEHGRAILDEAKVVEMRRLRSEGWSTGRLAGRYGVNRNTICYAISGKTWSHVEAAPPANGGTA